MSMNYEEKEKCSEIWEMMTGIQTTPAEWNESAGDALAEMVATMRTCSNAFKFVPHPVGSKPGYGWLVGYVYQVLKSQYSMDRHRVFEYCLTVRVGNWKSIIETELATGN